MKADPTSIEVRAKVSVIIDTGPPGPVKRIAGWTATAYEQHSPVAIKTAKFPKLRHSIDKALIDAEAHFQEAHNGQTCDIQDRCRAITRELEAGSLVTCDRWADYTTVLDYIQLVIPTARHLVYLGMDEELAAELNALGFSVDDATKAFAHWTRKVFWAVLGRGCQFLTLAWKDEEGHMLCVRLPDAGGLVAAFCQRCGARHDIVPTPGPGGNHPAYYLPQHKGPCELPCLQRREGWKETKPTHCGDFDCPECWPTKVKEKTDGHAEQGTGPVPSEEPQEGDHA